MSEVYIVKTEGQSQGKGVFVTESWSDAAASIHNHVLAGRTVTVELAHDQSGRDEDGSE